MQQVTDWLESSGNSEYTQHFADDDIDFSIVGDLTDQDLKDVGVASLGHRRKILRTISDKFPKFVINKFVFRSNTVLNIPLNLFA